tara:strand:+ start:547 stop:879 length:333 start_codon:yes stop_codon:yes gene_type:complete
MENEYLSMQLIRNTYNVDEGKTIIEQLLADKINFLKKQIFKLEERFGADSPFLKNRVIELRKCQEDLDLFLNHVDEDQQEMLINCKIDIQLVPTKNEEKISQQAEKQQWT